MRKLVIGASAALLAACGSSDSGTVETEDGTAEYDISSDDDGAEIRLTDDDGNETIITTGGDGEAAFPSGYTVYPGAEIVSNTVMSGAEGNGNLIIMTSSASPADMMAHFREQAEAAGIDLQMEMNSGDMQMIGGEGPDNRFFSFTASVSGGETTGMLTVGDR